MANHKSALREFVHNESKAFRETDIKLKTRTFIQKIEGYYCKVEHLSFTRKWFRCWIKWLKKNVIHKKQDEQQEIKIS